MFYIFILFIYLFLFNLVIKEKKNVCIKYITLQMFSNVFVNVIYLVMFCYFLLLIIIFVRFGATRKFLSLTN